MSGLEYKKLDLHIHTPASRCFLDKKASAEEIITAAKKQGLEGIAITDHNTAEFIDAVLTAANKEDLVVYPGVEISLEAGYHLIAIFDPGQNQKFVENFLGSIGILPDQYGKSEAFCKENIRDVISKIHERNGLAILAHIDLPKGAFFELVEKLENGKIRVPVTCVSLFNEVPYDAVECSFGVLPEGFNAVRKFKRFPALYQSSDNPDLDQKTKHSLAGIGQKYSWFKLDQMNIEGLRQCFADPEVRIMMMNEYQPIGYSRIIEMSIGPNGFLRNQKFNFHNGLNCLIGGKGVGKSLAIEMLRFALDQVPKSDDSLLEDHIKKLEKRLEEGNSVELIYQIPDGTKYKITRVFEGRKGGSRSLNYDATVNCINLSTDEEFKGEITRLFPILAYSQTEVIKIAEDKNAQLELLDRFIDIRQIEGRIGDLKIRLRDNDFQLNDSILAHNQLEDCQRDIQTLQQQVNSKNKSLQDPLFDSFKLSEKKNSVYEQQIDHIDKFVDVIGEWQNFLLHYQLNDVSEEFFEDKEIQKNQKITIDSKVIIIEALKKTIPLLSNAKSQINSSFETWKPEFKQVSEDYDNLLKEIGGNKEAIERQRKKLDRQLEQKQREEQQFKNQSDELVELLKTRNQLLDQLERAYLDYYEIRREKYEELTNLSDNKLQLILAHAADRSIFLENLSDLLKGGQNSPSVADRTKIANNIMPRRFVQLVLNKNHAHLATETELTENWASKVIEKLWSNEDFTKVLALQYNSFPTDIPSIRFRKEGGEYDDLTELSIGQKCTALLIIALCDGEMPVIIDQPEDALDIISVWEDISKKLRRGKNTRQFILTTHNSSVAVASDTDQFIVLHAGANNGRVIYTGAIDHPDIKKAVIDILEGGKDPYILRSKKYNIQMEN